MNRIFIIVIMAAVVFGAGAALSAEPFEIPSAGRAGSPGTFFGSLDNVFCRGLSPWEKRVGCNGYLQYRIQHGYDRGKAQGTCPWGCSMVFKSRPGMIPGCQQGCSAANAKDKR